MQCSLKYLNHTQEIIWDSDDWLMYISREDEIRPSLVVLVGGDVITCVAYITHYTQFIQIF